MGSTVETTGIRMPIELQIQNLSEVVRQLQTIANKNILGDSLNGQKINQELKGTLRTLESIERRAKTAFKTKGDFSNLDKQIANIESGIEHIRTLMGNLKFSDINLQGLDLSKLYELEGALQKAKEALAGFNVKGYAKTLVTENKQ